MLTHFSSSGRNSYFNNLVPCIRYPITKEQTAISFIFPIFSFNCSEEHYFIHFHCYLFSNRDWFPFSFKWISVIAVKWHFYFPVTCITIHKWLYVKKRLTSLWNNLHARQLGEEIVKIFSELSEVLHPKDPHQQ